MATIDLGDVVPLSVQVRDGAAHWRTRGDHADRDAARRHVDGGVDGKPVDRQLHRRLHPDAVSRHVVRWVATGANACAFSDAFTVIDPTDLGLVGLDDVKRHLNITGTGSDEELRAVLMAATAAAEDYLRRPLRRLSQTQTFYTSSGNGRGLVLSRTDVASVASVVEDGTTLTAADYDANLSAGVVWRADCREWCYPTTVTYTTAGIGPRRCGRRCSS